MNMTTCPRCHAEYDQEAPHCPTCRAPRLSANLQPRPRRRCGPLAYFCLRFACVATLLGVGITVIAGLVGLASGQFIKGLVILLIGTPIAIGHFAALGLAVDYAESTT